MRSPLIFTIVFLLCTALNAQFTIPLKSNNNGRSLRNAIQKVVEAFPHEFASIRGEVIAQNPQTVEYASVVKPFDARETMIIQYSSELKPVYSWQTVLVATEDYNEAVKKYKSVFTELKGMNVKYIVDQYTLRGDYEEPDESRQFTTSVLAPMHPPLALKKLKVEVSMQFEFPEWKVAVMVYEKQKEDGDQFSDTE